MTFGPVLNLFVPPIPEQRGSSLFPGAAAEARPVECGSGLTEHILPRCTNNQRMLRSRAELRMNELGKLNIDLAILSPVPGGPQVAAEQLLHRRVAALNAVLPHSRQSGRNSRAELPDVVRSKSRGTVANFTARDSHTEKRFARL